ncbi:hypothetical protein Tco_1420230 [Tanacetum coccineum]
MAALKFASLHNMVAFLDKHTESDGFKQIVDFLNAHPIKYALTVNPTIDTLCIEQFCTTSKVKIVNGEVQIQALVDKKKVIITETSIRSDLQLEDAEGTECLPNATIFEQLTLIGAKTTAWKEFSSTMTSAVICLATNQKFNFSKYIFDNMVKNLEGGVKFLMYPRDTPLFPTMIVQAQEQVGEGSDIPTNSYHTPTTTQPSTSKPQKKQSRRKQMRDIEDPQLSGPTEPITDDTENVTTLDLEKTKTSQAAGITKLKERVKKLEKKGGSRTHRLKRLYKVGRSTRVVSSKDEGLVNETQGRYGDNLMFDIGVLDNEQDMTEKEVDMAEKDVSIADLVTTASEVVTTANVVVSTTEVITDSTTTTIVDELTLAQTLIEIKATKPKDRGAKDKGKAKMVELEKPLKKKDQIMFDKEVAQKLQAQLDAELEEEEKLARQREEDTNIAEWDNVQAMMDADYELAARL